MKRLQRVLILGLVLLAVPVIAGDQFHEGKTVLSGDEKAAVLKIKEKKTGFTIAWKNPDLKEFGLLKWNNEASCAVTDAPPELLDAIRDNIGKLNQKDRKGEPLSVAVNVYRFKKQGFMTNPVAFFEIVARTKDGKTAWIVLDQVKPTQELAESMADSNSAIIGREVYRKMREEFNL